MGKAEPDRRVCTGVLFWFWFWTVIMPRATNSVFNLFLSSQPWDLWMKNCFNTAGVIVKAAVMQELWFAYEQRRGNPSHAGQIKHYWLESVTQGRLLIPSAEIFYRSPASFHGNISLWKHMHSLQQLLLCQSGRVSFWVRMKNEGCSGSHWFLLTRGFRGQSSARS